MSPQTGERTPTCKVRLKRLSYLPFDLWVGDVFHCESSLRIQVVGAGVEPQPLWWTRVQTSVQAYGDLKKLFQKNRVQRKK
jgi:hypothetical protein